MATRTRFKPSPSADTHDVSAIKGSADVYSCLGNALAVLGIPVGSVS